MHEPKKGLAKGSAINLPDRHLEIRQAPQHYHRHARSADQPGPGADPGAEIVQGIKEVVVMGGAHFNGGNITPVAEFNLFADPQAAEVVLKSGVKLTYLPLDVTHKILTSEARLKQIAALNNNASQSGGRHSQ